MKARDWAIVAILALIYLLSKTCGSNNSSSSDGYPIEHKTKPCDRCGDVGTYYEEEDGSTSGDRRYSLHGGWYCYGCYQTMKKFSKDLGF